MSHLFVIQDNDHIVAETADSSIRHMGPTLDLQQGDCLELMRAMPANSVDLIATDPPYYKVKGDAWDRQWDTPAAFLAWFDLLAEQWQRSPENPGRCLQGQGCATRDEGHRPQRQ